MIRECSNTACGWRGVPTLLGGRRVGEPFAYAQFAPRNVQRVVGSEPVEKCPRPSCRAPLKPAVG